MSFPTLHLSRPAIRFPKTRIDNDDLLARIRANYRGAPEGWPAIEEAVRHIFAKCHSEVRYIEEDLKARMGDYAASAAREVMDRHGVSPDEVDLVIYGGISREYFEPATAMEVAAKAGLTQVHAFDVTSACAGHLEGLHIACAFLNLYPHYRTALVCAAELTRDRLDYDIQSPEEMVTKAAGLTIGNAAAAFLVRRDPFPGGCARLLAVRNHSLPRNWELCSAPIDGSFTSYSAELFRLNVHVAPEILRLCEAVGWTPQDVAHYVSHQPSESIVQKVLIDLGVPLDRAILTHHLYANTASTTVAVTFHHLLEQGVLRDGDKLIFSTAAAGFSMVNAAAIWVA